MAPSPASSAPYFTFIFWLVVTAPHAPFLLRYSTHQTIWSCVNTNRQGSDLSLTFQELHHWLYLSLLFCPFFAASFVLDQALAHPAPLHFS